MLHEWVLARVHSTVATSQQQKTNLIAAYHDGYLKYDKLQFVMTYKISLGRLLKLGNVSHY